MAFETGLIGLGAVGSGLALNLARSGFPLLISDARPKENFEALLREGAGKLVWVSSDELCRRCTTVLTSLPSVAIIATVAEKVIFPNLKGTWIDLSTTDEEEVKRLGPLAKARGIDLLEVSARARRRRTAIAARPHARLCVHARRDLACMQHRAKHVRGRAADGRRAPGRVGRHDGARGRRRRRRRQALGASRDDRRQGDPLAPALDRGLDRGLDSGLDNGLDSVQQRAEPELVHVCMCVMCVCVSVCLPGDPLRWLGLGLGRQDHLEHARRAAPGRRRRGVHAGQEGGHRASRPLRRSQGGARTPECRAPRAGTPRRTPRDLTLERRTPQAGTSRAARIASHALRRAPPHCAVATAAV
eukprot:398529-Prymnesium_polylepis.1